MRQAEAVMKDNDDISPSAERSRITSDFGCAPKDKRKSYAKAMAIS